MRKHLLLLFAMCFVQLMAFAGPRSYQQALKIAQQQAERLGISMDAMSPQPRMVQKTNGIDPAYYVIENGTNKGYTIVSADDRLPEIVGYAKQGNYTEDTLPEAYVEFITAYQKFVEEVKAGNPHALRTAAEAKALRESASYTQPTVAPLLGNIQWNQGDPYNRMCPEYDGVNKAVTGCVATAMAQVMGYWKYPSQLQADIPGYTTGTYNINVPGINKDTDGTYDWDNILPQYNSGNFNDDQANAVAKLMHHCGVAVQMNYGPSSGAVVYPERLSKYFGYDKDFMVKVRRESYSMQEWNTLIDNELIAKRPVLYSGQSSSGGHQFVCDGSDGKGLYHINWGWGGYQDGYFDITILNPAKGGIGSGNAPDGYNQGSDMIIGIMPDNGQEDIPLVTLKPIYATGISTDTKITITQDTRTSATDNFKIEFYNYFTNRAPKKFSGYCGWGIKAADGSMKLITNTSKVQNLQQNYWFPNTYKIDYAFPVGVTTIYPVYSEDNITWKEAGLESMGYYTVEATETSLKQLYPLTAEVIVESELLSGKSNTIKLDVSNATDNDVFSMLSVYTSTDQTCPEDGVNVYVSVPAKGKSIREVAIPVPAEEFYLWVKDVDSGTELVSAKKFTATPSGIPQLELVQVVTNASNEFETEDAYYNNDRVKAPKVKDDKLVVRYDIKNNGGLSSGDWSISGFSAKEFNWGGTTSSTIVFPGNGTITQLTATFTPDALGCKTIYVQLDRINDYDNTGSMVEYKVTTSLPDWQLPIIDMPGYAYQLDPSVVVAYVAGAEGGTGIGKVDISKTYIRGDHGQINITTDRNKTVNIYKLNGQKVTEVKATAGQPVSIPVAAGIYVVDGTKVAVK